MRGGKKGKIGRVDVRRKKCQKDSCLQAINRALLSHATPPRFDHRVHLRSQRVIRQALPDPLLILSANLFPRVYVTSRAVHFLETKTVDDLVSSPKPVKLFDALLLKLYMHPSLVLEHVSVAKGFIQMCTLTSRTTIIENNRCNLPPPIMTQCLRIERKRE